MFDKIKHDHSFERRSEDCLAAFFPVIKAIQAALTLGTGGPFDQWVQVWILANAKGCSEMMENNRERRAAPVAAGVAAGIASAIDEVKNTCINEVENTTAVAVSCCQNSDDVGHPLYGLWSLKYKFYNNRLQDGGDSKNNGKMADEYSMFGIMEVEVTVFGILEDIKTRLREKKIADEKIFHSREREIHYRLKDIRPFIGLNVFGNERIMNLATPFDDDKP
ncbi:hypothetical protein HPP92_027037 [Vanilla planifolia]|uniref:Uncharacterized protein n=1 Tax=Vanilla planifolia TaxID=51239 RepID=A0A835PD31_VANPL|nr:hypothetical protein HPP92_027037 [Vanilla planifolia]